MIIDLNEIEQRAREAAALAEAATAGPWGVDTDHGGVHSISLCVDIAKSFDYEDGQDATFIAASRTAVPALAADVLALVVRVKALEAQLKSFTDFNAVYLRNE